MLLWAKEQAETDMYYVVAEGLEFGNSVYSVSFDEEYQQKVRTLIYVESSYSLIPICEIISSVFLLLRGFHPQILSALSTSSI